MSINNLSNDSELSIEKAYELADKARNKYLRKRFNTKDDIISYDDPKKYRIVKKFIQDRGLILYGGISINSSLPREDKIYKPNAIPDYDMYSPDPWNDAVELVNRLNEAGYEYSEVRGAIHKGTYKVFSNMWPVADITYFPKDDFDKIKTKTKNGMKMIGNSQIQADAFKQLSNLNELHRWEKVYKRQKLFEKWNQPSFRKYECSKDFFIDENTKIPEEILEILEKTQKFIKRKKLLYSGPVAYNTYIEIGGGTQRLLADHFNVLSENANTDATELLKYLDENMDIDNNLFNINIHYQPAKPVNNVSYIITIRNHIICSITQLTNCVGYKYLKGKYVAGIDYIKWLWYSDLAFAEGKDASRLKCQLKYLTEIQNKYYKTKRISDIDNSPFQRLNKNCKGPLEEGLKVTLLNRWVDRVEKRGNIKQIKPTTDNIVLNNVKGLTIRIFPKEEDICINKSKDDCKYPCNWNDDNKKCYSVPFIYRVGEPPLEEYPFDDNSIPSYDGSLYPQYGVNNS